MPATNLTKHKFISINKESAIIKSRLWKHFQLGQMELRNRIVLPPMVTEYGSEEGYVTERIKNYYEARARGGAALIIVESSHVHNRGRNFLSHLCSREQKRRDRFYNDGSRNE